MPEPKFHHGDIVRLDPTHEDYGPVGKVVGIVHWIDGTTGYFVSVYSGLDGSIKRHLVTEEEISLVRRNA